MVGDRIVPLFRPSQGASVTGPLRRLLSITLLVFSVSSLPGQQAGSPQPVSPTPSTEVPGSHERGTRVEDTCFLETLAGAYYSSSIGPGLESYGIAKTSFDYAPIVARVGCRPFQDWCLWFPRTSVMLEGMVAPVFHGFGSAIGGPSLLMRLDLLPSDSTLVPYLQVGTGLAFNDAYRDQQQRGIGQSTEFLQQAELGVRWKMREGVSLLVEGGVQHISNAGLAARNAGVNALGGNIGLEWKFP